jgi:hypothetical protein
VRYSDTAVLIVGYRRFDNIKLIIELCLAAGVERIYLSIDGAKNSLELIDLELGLKSLDDYLNQELNVVNLKVHNTNLGSAVNVLSACDWVFSLESFAIILEDDCIPSLDFFAYIEDVKSFVIENPKIYMASGSQFAPSSVTRNTNLLSSYPLIWGWATSHAKWRIMRDELINNLSSKNNANFASKSEFRFWQSGSRRAKEGMVDAWDIPLVFAIKTLNGLVILPGINLIRNIGNDLVATHMKKESKWVGIPTHSYVRSTFPLEHSPEVDSWLRDSLYRIRTRHYFTTKLSLFLDRIKFYKRVRAPLLDRWPR